MKVSIRPLTRSDAPAYHAVRLRMLREHPDAFTSSYEENAEQPLSWAEERLDHGPDAPDDFLLGAFSESGELVGTVDLTRRRRGKERHAAHIAGMYVVREAASQGIGRALMRASLDRAAALPGLEQITLTVTASNEHAVSLYRSLGFIVYGMYERAIKVEGRYYAKAQMVLYLRDAE